MAHVDTESVKEAAIKISRHGQEIRGLAQGMSTAITEASWNNSAKGGFQDSLQEIIRGIASACEAADELANGLRSYAERIE